MNTMPNSALAFIPGIEANDLLDAVCACCDMPVIRAGVVLERRDADVAAIQWPYTLLESLPPDKLNDAINAAAMLIPYTCDSPHGMKLRHRIRQIALEYYEELKAVSPEEWAAFLKTATLEIDSEAIKVSEAKKRFELSSPVEWDKVSALDIAKSAPASKINVDLPGYDTDPLSRAAERVRYKFEAALEQGLHTGNNANSVSQQPIDRKEAQRWARQQSGQMIDDITKADRTRIAKAIRDGIKDGLSQDQVVGRILDTVKDDQINLARAKMIAVTETNTALSRGAMMAAANEGAVSKSWIVVSDNRLCDVCADNGNAGTLDIDDQFPSGDTITPAHPNCRCFVLYHYPQSKEELKESKKYNRHLLRDRLDSMDWRDREQAISHRVNLRELRKLDKPKEAE